MMCSTIPKLLFETVERIGRSGVGFGGVHPRVLFIPSCPTVTGLTGVCLLWDLPLGELLDLCVFGSWCCWSVLGLFGVVLLGVV
jgi:hypothetical protein